MIFNIFLGITCFFISLLYLYKTSFLIKLFSFLRNYVFTDTSILIYRKKIGIAFLSFSIIILYSTIYTYLKNNLLIKENNHLNIIEEINIQRAISEFSQGDYDKTILFCNRILTNNPKNIKALMLSGSANMILKRYNKAKLLWSSAALLDPKNQTINTALKSIHKPKKDIKK